MPLVRPYRRRNPSNETTVTLPREFHEAKEAKIVIVTPQPPEQPPHRSTPREKIKKALAVPAHLKKKKRPKPKNDFEEFADEADDIARTFEKLEKGR